MVGAAFAFSLTLFSAFFMLLGAFIGVATKRDNSKILCLALGFSGGIMLYLAFTEILPKANENIQSVFPGTKGYLIAVLSFFSGMLFLSLFNTFLNHRHEDLEDGKNQQKITFFSQGNSMDCLYKMGVFSAISIGIHNFPEGITTFISALKDPLLGITVAVAIGLHNLSVGMAIAIPIYFSSGNRKAAIFYTFLSAMTSPTGALMAYLFLLKFLNDLIFGILFGIIAGIMVFICLDEILPTAEKFGKHHLVISGIIFGMLIMSLSIIFIG